MFLDWVSWWFIYLISLLFAQLHTNVFPSKATLLSFPFTSPPSKADPSSLGAPLPSFSRKALCSVSYSPCPVSYPLRLLIWVFTNGLYSLSGFFHLEILPPSSGCPHTQQMRDVLLLRLPRSAFLVPDHRIAPQGPHLAPTLTTHFKCSR